MGLKSTKTFKQKGEKSLHQFFSGSFFWVKNRPNFRESERFCQQFEKVER